MVYKKYIKKDGKLYGPYVYHSRRVNGKVISEYHGVGKTFNYKTFLLIFFGVFLLMALIYVLIFPNDKISGKAVLNLEANYQEDQPFEGNLILSLEEGELIPASSKIIFETSEQEYAFDLENLVSDELVEGDFYVKEKTISGKGLGYGTKGTKKNYPTIYFTLDVYSQTNSEEILTEEKISEEGTEELNETIETIREELVVNETIEETEAEITEGIPFETEQEIMETSEEIIEQPEEISEEIIGEKAPIEETEAEVQETPSEIETPSERSPITGNVISKLFKVVSNSFLRLTGQVSIEFGTEIPGEVSANKSFSYDLEEGQNAEILPRSVKTDSEILPDDAVELSIEGNKVIVTTNYFQNEQGFGEDYLGDNGKTLAIDISDLDLIIEQGELEISLVYDEEEIISLTTLLKEGEIIANESYEKEISNETRVKLNITTKINHTVNKTILANITPVTEVSDVLTGEEREILFKEFGNASIKQTANLINERIVVKYELGNYWIKYSYDSDAKDLDFLMETDRIKWLKDLAKELSREESVPEEIENFSGTKSF